MHHVCNIQTAHLCQDQTLNQKEVKVYARQLPASSTDVLKTYHFLAGLGREGRVFGTKTANSIFAFCQYSLTKVCIKIAQKDHFSRP